MSEEEAADDWFERAVRGDDDEDVSDEDGDGEESADDWFSRAVTADTEQDEPAETEGFDEEDGTSDGDSPEGSDTGGGAGGTADDESAGPDDGSMFEQDFASALDGAPDVSGGGTGGSGGFDEDFGMGGDAGTDGTIDEDFGMGGGEDFGMGGGEDFGMGGGEDFGMGGGEDFEAEEAESDIDRIDLGIEGLDEMVQGGVPRRSLMVTIGSAGTGKTTFGLQFLNEGLQQGDRAIFIALEESRERIINSATEKGMPFDEYAAEGELAIVDLDPVEMANSLSSIRSELPRLIDEFGATRLVLDSVSLLEMMYDERAARRNEIFDFTQSLKRSGVTTMMTSEASEDSPYASRHGIVEYLTDAVFILQYVRPSDFRETRLAVEIQKIRDANHSRETKPYEITDQGISVYRQANIF